MDHKKQSDQLPWSVPVTVADIADEGKHVDLAADEAARAKIAAAAGLRTLPKLTASFDLQRQGDGVHVAGFVSGRAGQSCVVTLDLVESDVEETVDLDFAPASDEDAATAHTSSRKKQDDDPPEPFYGGVIDLGAVATEFLILGLDPYPRAPGAAFEPLEEKETGSSPFAALESLKKRPE